MRTPPLYVCPICEPGPYSYAGAVIAKTCSRCLRGARDAKTGADRLGVQPVKLEDIFREYDEQLRRSR